MDNWAREYVAHMMVPLLGERGEEAHDTCSALDRALRALEKQVQRNVVRYDGHVYCPNCHITFERDMKCAIERNCEFDYCPNCGQNISWCDGET